MKGLFKLYLLIVFLVLILFLIRAIYRKQWQNLVRPQQEQVRFSGSPPYIAGKTSGSPLSEMGSHCGFKVVSEKEDAAATALFATVASFGAGRIYDFAVSLKDESGNAFFKRPRSRQVNFLPYCLEETSEDGSLRMHSRLYFIQHNIALLETEWEALGPLPGLRPILTLMPTGGRDLENPYPHFNGFSFFKRTDGGLLLSNYHRWPGQKLRAFFLPSSGDSVSNKELLGEWLNFKSDQRATWSVLISFTADRDLKLISRAQRALRFLEPLRKSAEKRWINFAGKLPLLPEEDRPGKEVFKLAAWAMQNSLYSPRGSMTAWGSVPSKVYFPFIWGWDTPQHVIGISEWNPSRAGEILLTQFQGNFRSPEKSRFKLKAKGITFLSGAERHQIPSKIDDTLRGVLDFYSQPPLQSWAAVRVYQRLRRKEEKDKFLRDILPAIQGNLRWWEDNRRMAGGLFSYINGLESGLDDSPRFYPPSYLPSFIIGLVPRIFAAVDLNCWLYQSYMNTAYLCRKAGLDQSAGQLRTKSEALKKEIDNKLWSDRWGCWLDQQNGDHIEVKTPSIWWPAFVGAESSREKVEAVIGEYLLNGSKFWGDFGIPSVAFDDHAYNNRKDGYYWRGQIWMINNYSALEVLFRFGYAREAEELHEKIMQTLSNSRGLYETYNARTGAVGWSSRGPGDPAVMQFGMSSAWATQIAFFRYQHFRYIFPETKGMEGYIHRAAEYGSAPLLSPPGIEVESDNATLEVTVPGGHRYDLPKLKINSLDGAPLLRSALIRFSFTDPFFSSNGEREITFAWQGTKYRVRPNCSYLLKPGEAEVQLSPA